MRYKAFKIFPIIFGLLIITGAAGINAATMDVIEDSLKFSLVCNQAYLLPGSSEISDDTIATVQFKMQFLTQSAPPGTVNQVDFYFTWDTTKWYYNGVEVEDANWTGDVDSMGNWSTGSAHLKLTGSCTPSTTSKTLVYMYFVPKCQQAGYIGGETYIYFDQGEDNGALVVNGGSSNWYETSSYTNTFMMLSAYITIFLIDPYDSAEALMGDVVTVPVYIRQHTFPHRLYTIEHQISFDTTKLQFLDAYPNDAAFQCGKGTLSYSGSGPVEISVQDSADGYIIKPYDTYDYVKIYDMEFRVRGFTDGSGDTVAVTFIDSTMVHTPWTKWNEGGGGGCDALDTTVYTLHYDGDVKIPEYTASMIFSPVTGYYNKGDGYIDFLCSIQNNFPAGDYSSTNGNGGIGTLFDMPAFMGMDALADSNGLDFVGQTYINGDRLFYANQQYNTSPYVNYVMSDGQYSNMYKVTFTFNDNNYTPDYDDRTVTVPWRAGGNGWTTFVEDTTGYATLDLDDIADSTVAFNVHMGRFYAPYSTDEDVTVSQPLYISSTFDIGEFSVNVSVAGDCRITGVTTEDGVEYSTVSTQEVQIYYDDTAKFCDAYDDSLILIATVHYRIYCYSTLKSSSDGGGGSSYYVTGAVSFDDEVIEEYQGDEQFVDLVPNNVRGKCVFINLPRENEDAGSALPGSFALYPNRPNPFNPTTVIAYDVPIATHVTIEVVNILGQSVTTLVDEIKAAGHYEAVWNGVDRNGTKVASGIYLYNMRAGDYIETRKMMLMK